MTDQGVCMIYKRSLPTGCDNCGLSLNACQASSDINRERCCPNCAHPEPS